jgi:hypothetical protein
MKLFLAALDKKAPWSYEMNPPYILSSYFDVKNMKAWSVPKSKDFILDSGVFTFLTSKKSIAATMDWNQYVDEYADFVKKHRIKNYVEIDVDKILGLKEVERLRDRLEERVGWKSMPVWHMNRGWDGWLKMVKEYDYVCFGAFITDGLKQRNFAQINHFIHVARQHGAKTHGLGFTSTRWLPKIKFDSVDSSSWTSGGRYGYLMPFTGRGIKFIRNKDTRVKVHHKELDRQNLASWIKFAEYVEQEL